MAYIGQKPANRYSRIDKQVITGDGGTVYTLDHTVANENELEVFVNNVRQEPGNAYVAFGTTLSMTDSVTANDGFYVVFQGKSNETISIPEKNSSGYNFANGTLFIDIANSRVGISNTAPSEALTVTGNVRVNGTITSPNVVGENIVGEIGVNVGNTRIVSSGMLGFGSPVYALANIVYLTSGTDATYTPPQGVRAIYVEVVGGGGGGGGADGQGSGSSHSAESGGGGGYSAKFITDLNQVFKYTVGAGGSGGAAGQNGGTAGGTSYFYGGVSGTDVLAQATGGGGGGGVNATAGNSLANAGASGGIGSIGQLNLTGRQSSDRSVSSGDLMSLSLSGSAPFFGGGKMASRNINGANATNYGEGGAGGAVNDTTSNYAGGDGFQGVVRITEYY